MHAVSSYALSCAIEQHRHAWIIQQCWLHAPRWIKKADHCDTIPGAIHGRSIMAESFGELRFLNNFMEFEMDRRNFMYYEGIRRERILHLKTHCVDFVIHCVFASTFLDTRQCLDTTPTNMMVRSLTPLALLRRKSESELESWRIPEGRLKGLSRSMSTPRSWKPSSQDFWVIID